MKRTALLAVSGLLAVSLAACGDDGGGATVEVSMTEYAFDPAPIVVGEGGQLAVSNDGAETHNLTIPDLGKGLELGPGGEATLHLDGQDPGTYRVICDLPGHVDQGMVTEITIG